MYTSLYTFQISILNGGVTTTPISKRISSNQHYSPKHSSLVNDQKPVLARNNECTTPSCRGIPNVERVQCSLLNAGRVSRCLAAVEMCAAQSSFIHSKHVQRMSYIFDQIISRRKMSNWYRDSDQAFKQALFVHSVNIRCATSHGVVTLTYAGRGTVNNFASAQPWSSVWLNNVQTLANSSLRTCQLNKVIEQCSSQSLKTAVLGMELWIETSQNVHKTTYLMECGVISWNNKC